MNFIPNGILGCVYRCKINIFPVNLSEVHVTVTNVEMGSASEL
jgi:hypothetical protein